MKLIKDYDCVIDYHPRKKMLSQMLLVVKIRQMIPQMIVMKENYWS